MLTKPTKPLLRVLMMAFQEQGSREMLPLYAVRIEDLGQGDFLKLDCTVCHHVALVTPEALRGLGLPPAARDD